MEEKEYLTKEKIFAMIERGMKKVDFQEQIGFFYSEQGYIYVTYLSIMLRSMTRACLKMLIFIRKLILWKSAEISNGRLLRCMSAWIGSTLKPFMMKQTGKKKQNTMWKVQCNVD